MWCPECQKDVKVGHDTLGNLMCSICGSPIGVVMWKKQTFKLRKSTAIVIPTELVRIMGLTKKRNPVLIYFRDGDIIIKRDSNE